MRLPVLRDGELERWLEAYAVVRLSPDHERAVRIRTRVMREWDRRATSIAAVVRGAATPPRPRARPHFRRAIAPLLAAALGTSVLVGSAFAATPGGPLYAVRVWTEALSLPADAPNRVRAQLARLDQRMAEAVAGVESGNTAGAAAAVIAYREILLAAMADAAAGDAEVVELLEPAVARHRQILASLMSTVPAAVRPEIREAIQGLDLAAQELAAAAGAPTPSSGGAIAPSGPDPSETPATRPTDDVRVPAETPRTAAPAGTATPRPSLAPASVDVGGPTPRPNPAAQPKPAPIQQPVATPTRTPPSDREPTPRPSTKPTALPAVPPTSQPAPVLGEPPTEPAIETVVPSPRLEQEAEAPAPDPSPAGPDAPRSDAARVPSPSPTPSPSATPSATEPGGSPEPGPASPSKGPPVAPAPTPSVPVRSTEPEADVGPRATSEPSPSPS